jgi:membrane protein
VSLLKRIIAKFARDKGMLLSAALAFYTALAFGPGFVLLLWVASILGVRHQEQVITGAETLLGPGGSAALGLVLKSAQERPDIGTLAGVLGVGGLLLAATTVFTQAQQALNIVWGVGARGGVVRGLLRKRLSGLVMLIFLLMLVLVNVVASAVLTRLADLGSVVLPESRRLLWVANLAVSLAVFTLTFAAMFKHLPDVRIAWTTTWFGAVTTAVMFVLGKFLAGLYLSHSAIASAYGAGGALLVLLVWVYYSWAIVLLGAETTQVWAERYHHAVGSDTPT